MFAAKKRVNLLGKQMCPFFHVQLFARPESLLCTDIYHLVSTLHSDEIFFRQFGILSKSAFRFDVRFLFSAKRFQQTARKLFLSGAVIVGANFVIVKLFCSSILV